MKFWKWQEGRQQDTKYWKFPLWSFRIWKWGFDAYILKYAPNTILPWHTDPVKDGKHWRKNLTIKGYSIFKRRKNGVEINHCFGRTPWFRPDLEEHMVQTYCMPCKKLSFGFVKFK